MLSKEEILQKIKNFPSLSSLIGETGALQELYNAVEEYANQDKKKLLDELGEKEVMISAFAKVRQLFEMRSWIMEGRGSYPYNDDRYKEEVRYLFDEFDALQKDVWKNIKTKTFEYREKIIAEYANQNKWINCKDELPDVEKVGNKVLLFREMNEGQKGMAITVYDTFLVRHCDPETTFWQPLPNPPKQ